MHSDVQPCRAENPLQPMNQLYESHAATFATFEHNVFSERCTSVLMVTHEKSIRCDNRLHGQWDTSQLSNHDNWDQHSSDSSW